MRRAQVFPASEVDASWLGGCEHVLTAGALELLAVPHGAVAAMPRGALDCGTKNSMADFEDSNTPTFDNLVTGQLKVRNVSQRRYRQCSPDTAA